MDRARGGAGYQCRGVCLGRAAAAARSAAGGETPGGGLPARAARAALTCDRRPAGSVSRLCCPAGGAWLYCPGATQSLRAGTALPHHLAQGEHGEGVDVLAHLTAPSAVVELAGYAAAGGCNPHRILRAKLWR